MIQRKKIYTEIKKKKKKKRIRPNRDKNREPQTRRERRMKN